MNPRAPSPAGPDQQEALVRLDFLLDRDTSCGLLLGPPDAGKSRLLRRFLSRCRGRGVSAALLPAAIDRHAALVELSGQWGLAPGEWQDSQSLWRLIADRIREHRFEGKRGVVLLDDISLANEELTEFSLLLLATAEAMGSPLALVIASRPSELKRVSPDLLGRVELRIELGMESAPPAAAIAPPANRAEHENLRDSIVFVSPGKLPELDPAAVARLHKLAEAMPRLDPLAEPTLSPSASGN